MLGQLGVRARSVVVQGSAQGTEPAIAHPLPLEDNSAGVTQTRTRLATNPAIVSSESQPVDDLYNDHVIHSSCIHTSSPAVYP